MTPSPARLLLSLLLPALAAAIPSGHAEPAMYALDPVHTRVLFEIGHAGFSQALGTVSGSEGSVRFDPDDWQAARVDVTVPLQRLDLGDAQWNRAALAANLLDAARWPQARFVSDSVEAIDAHHARVHGTLTLHGVSRPLILEVTVNALKRHPLPPFRRTVGFSATATLSRSAFGIRAWPSMIGDEVGLRLEVEAVREGRSEAAPAAPAGAPPQAAAVHAPAHAAQ